MTAAAPDKIKTTIIFPRYLKAQFDYICNKKNLSKTAVILFLIEKWMRDECRDMNIDINQITTTTDLKNPPKLVHNDDDSWF